MDEAIDSGAPKAAKWVRVRALLEALLEVPAGERSAWLDKACGTDASLRAELESLAAASAGGASFLDRPALEYHAPGQPAPDSETATMSTDAVPLLAPAVLAPGVTIGHYRLVAKLGEGGMGVVYKAVDVRLDRIVAVKLITQFGESGVERRRFFREAKAASALNHPNIVTIYEYDAEGTMDYMAMEYIPGTTLDRLTADRTLPLKILAGYACQIAGALARAHEAGVVHRDLKPGNIMVTAEGIVKVLDFGLARYLADPDGADSLTRAGATVGTPGYMSPEQAKGEPADHRSDIFSFGIILYEMACGCHPFRGSDRLATLNNIVRQEPRPAAAVNPAIPDAVAVLIERCLCKTKEERVQSLAEVHTGLLAAMPLLETGAVENRAADSQSPKGMTPRTAQAGAAVLVALALAGGLWLRSQRHEPLVLTYRLEAERAGGAPREASSRETFHAGDKFRLRLESPHAGFLYLINEGPGPNAVRRFWVLHPPVSGSAALAANRPFETGWYVFDPNPGTEQLWLAFSHDPVPTLQDALATSEAGEVKDSARAVKVGDFLSRLERPSKTVVAGSNVRLQAAETVLAAAVQLRHE
jgi:predicted Ser/Thr protein kinase